MLTQRDKILIGVGALSLVVLAATFSGEPRHQICDYPNEYETICNKYHVLPYLFVELVRASDAHIGSISLLTGVLLAMFTLGLVLLGGKADSHFRVGERAYVKVSPVDPGVKWDGEIGGGYTIVWRIKNFGNTPAKVTDAVSNAIVVPKDMIFDEMPAYARHDFVKETKAFLVKDDEFYQHPHSAIETAERPIVEDGTERLIVYGYADYIDQFGVRHRAGFGRQYLPNATTLNLIFPDTGAFNYDRVRKRGEGIDWD